MANANPYTHTRVCKDCGKVMHNVYYSKLYCPECVKKRHDKQTAAWWAKKKDEINSPYPKEETAAQRIRNAEERDAAFRADCRAADDAGLSYGQYMLLKASKKPAGITSTSGSKKKVDG